MVYRVNHVLAKLNILPIIKKLNIYKLKIIIIIIIIIIIHAYIYI